MNPKRIIIVGTMAIAITISAGIFGNDASADTLSISISKSSNQGNIKAMVTSAEKTNITIDDDITEVLELASDEALYEAIYSGSSLADIAEQKQIPLQRIIDLQVAELTKQLDQRLSNGSIDLVTYLLQKLELPDIVANSVQVRMTN